MPLTDILFRKFVINKPATTKRKRFFDPSSRCLHPHPKTLGGCGKNIENAVPNMLWLRYAEGPCQPVLPQPVLPIVDSEQLWSPSALHIERVHIALLPLLSDKERASIAAEIIG